MYSTGGTVPRVAGQWTSGNTARATIANGKLHAVAAGDLTLTASYTDGGVTKTCTVDVTVSATPSGLRAQLSTAVYQEPGDVAVTVDGTVITAAPALPLIYLDSRPPAYDASLPVFDVEASYAGNITNACIAAVGTGGVVVCADASLKTYGMSYYSPVQPALAEPNSGGGSFGYGICLPVNAGSVNPQNKLTLIFSRSAYDRWRGASTVFPAAGARVTEADAPHCFKILVTGTDQVGIGHRVDNAFGLAWRDCVNYHIVGGDVQYDPGVYVTAGNIQHDTAHPGLIPLGQTRDWDKGFRQVAAPTNTAAAYNPSGGRVVFDRCLARAPKPLTRLGRCWDLRGSGTVVVDSVERGIYVPWINGARESDGQAVLMLGPGPFKIVGNDFEQATETILIGGDRTFAADGKLCVTQDAEIRRNYIHTLLKRSAAMAGYTDPYEQQFFVGIELKFGIRVLLEGNVVDGLHVNSDQYLFPYAFKASTGLGDAALEQLWDITMRFNKALNNGGAGILFAQQRGQAIARFAALHNLIECFMGGDWDLRTQAPSSNMAGSALQPQFTVSLAGATNVVIDYCTFVNDRIDQMKSDAALLGVDPGDSNSIAHVRFTNSIGALGAWEFTGPSAGGGKPALDTILGSTYEVTGNGGAFGNPSNGDGRYTSLPAGNAAVDYGQFLAQFVDAATKDYRVTDTSPWKGIAAGGKDPGVDLDLLAQYTAGVAA